VSESKGSLSLPQKWFCQLRKRWRI